MTLSKTLAYFGPLDLAAVLLIWGGWLGIGLLVDNARSHNPSVSVLMRRYRREWMRQFVTRQPRIFDATILSSLRQGTTFFASACMIALGGGLALIGNTERLSGVAADFTFETAPDIVWEVKIGMALIFVVNAFLKFVWAHRVFGYCAVVMAAVPNDPEDPSVYRRADQAAELNISAARSYNRGLRSIYFALAALTWLLGAWALLCATALTLAFLWRREFSSHSRQVLEEGLGTLAQEPVE
ncbi:hypothetical protein PSA7680_01923 [Pseudoruegeria aquimaris]|uniref:DUF599 domain-containing protein n=1 Tax=Pseudoruegeria aquimaris TaxID=393663 RepID=A0A1Y5SEZ7_9RHOB|nr:DUF599 domain-containing protein [Pseudoruegeria aquimaris]SLN39140.1 hypothetical protein PSA7680_01923 [Pseudoruegeria aquimaris]